MPQRQCHLKHLGKANTAFGLPCLEVDAAAYVKEIMLGLGNCQLRSSLGQIQCRRYISAGHPERLALTTTYESEPMCAARTLEIEILRTKLSILGYSWQDLKTTYSMLDVALGQKLFFFFKTTNIYQENGARRTCPPALFAPNLFCAPPCTTVYKPTHQPRVLIVVEPRTR